MAITEAPTLTTEDLEIFRHGDQPMILRLIRPDNGGPFPAIIDLHGGCWNNGDPGECGARGEALAEAYRDQVLDRRRGEAWIGEETATTIRDGLEQLAAVKPELLPEISGGDALRRSP